MATKPPGPPPRRFENHMSHGFVEHVRGEIYKQCSEFPTHVYNPRQAELQLEEKGRQIIVERLIAEFPDWWSMPQVTPDWPKAQCLINAERTSARMLVSWSPETDALRGGTPVDAIDFPIKQGPPSIGRRMIQKVLNAIPGKRVADPDLAPVGTPDGKAAQRKPEARTEQKQIHKQGPATGPKVKPRP